MRGKVKGKKQAKCWNHFKLISTEKVVDGLAESKVVFTYCQQRLAWQKRIGITYLNHYYKACAAKHGLLLTSQTQLQFGSSGAGSTTSPLSTWVYSKDNTRTEMVKFVVATELPLAITENQHSVSFVKEYLQRMYVGVSRNTLHADIIQYFNDSK